jgi:hypothetical protein
VAEIVTLIEQLLLPTVKPPFMVMTSVTILPDVVRVSLTETFGFPFMVNPLSAQLLIVSTMVTDAEVAVPV